MQINMERLGVLWSEKPYGDYLIAVDALLEKRVGRSSTQKELAYIAECQEEFCLPSECADSIITDDWVSHDELK